MSVIPKFFLGANSQNGFVSYFNQLQDFKSKLQLLILKGGPGSGKSSLMKKVLNHAMEKGHNLEIIPCASDPESLDAVIDYTAKFAIMDGTAPHTLDPNLPGARQHIMYTGDLWDCEKLASNANPISKLTEVIGDCHRGACSYIKAASALLCENASVSEKYINKKAADGLITEITDNLSTENTFSESRRLLSAVSVGGIEVFSDSVPVYADKIYVISDKWGGCADYIINKIYLSSILKGEEIIYCPCSLMREKCDHLIFPKSRIAVLKENNFIKFPFGTKINTDDFYFVIPMEEQLEKRQKHVSRLLVDAGNMVSDAKFLHDELEAFYVAAMDFSKSDDLFRKIIDSFY